MEYRDFVATLSNEGDAFVAAARSAGVDATVPSCPGWTVADLCAHVGRLHRWAAETLRARPAPPPRDWRERIQPPTGPALIDFVVEGHGAFVDLLEHAEPEEACWTWIDEQNVAFWARRQAHEMAIHRWDAQCATREPDPIDRTLAVDGIDELFDIRPFRPGGPPAGHGETIHLHCTDGDGEWLARFEPDGAVVTHEHAKGDAAARGTASDLLLLMWGRVPAERLEIFGDASLFTGWQDGTR
jgi:uncharacterized protein (TIGR03083 family)